MQGPGSAIEKVSKRMKQLKQELQQAKAANEAARRRTAEAEQQSKELHEAAVDQVHHFVRPSPSAYLHAMHRMRLCCLSLTALSGARLMP